jgi:hypothetical protein
MLQACAQAVDFKVGHHFGEGQLPIRISSAAMVKEKGRLIGIGIFELDEHFSTLDNPAALCALLYFRHCFLTYRGLEQAFAMLMGDTQASRDRRILVLR